MLKVHIIVLMHRFQFGIPTYCDLVMIYARLLDFI